MVHVDPAVLTALGLDGKDASIASHGGSGFASTLKLSAVKDGKPIHYFIKTKTGKGAETMFKGEHESLNAIHSAVPNLCPQSHAHGATSKPGEYFLATDFLDLRSSSSSSRGSGLSLAAKLAKLHTAPAPVPPGHDRPMFGFPVTTCCGDTEQNNSWKESWADFYADNRLRSILKSCIENNGADKELTQAVETVATKVVPRLAGEATMGKITPVVVHGDLWSGNHSRGQIAGQGGTEEVVFDAAAVYGHAEYELGIMNMFGGFGSSFWDEYEKLVPKAEPKNEWADRVSLYELYHHLNHFSIFGGGYRSGAMSIMKKLIAKYGK